MKAAALVIGASLLAASAFAKPEPPGVAGLAWMAGEWAVEREGRWTEESWSRPRGGVMLGTGRSGRGGEVQDWEFMRIAPDGEGVLSFWGSPKGAPAVPFRLVSLTGDEAVFENPAHDYPKRIVYRREGKALVATLSGAGGGNPISWRYRRR